MKDEIEKKTYNEIISELETLDLLKKAIITLSTAQLIVIYLVARTIGFNNNLMIFYVLTIAYFIIPLFIEIALKKANKHIS